MRYFTGASGVHSKDFFQKRCDMITLRFFQDEPCGVVLDLLYARGLFIGYSCESSIAVVNLDVITDATSSSVELLERNGRIEAILLSARNAVRQRILMCCFTDSVWSRCTARYLTRVSGKECNFHLYLQTRSRPN